MLLASTEVTDILGFGGDTNIAKKIIDGTEYIPQITDNKAAQLLLESIKQDTYPFVIDFNSQDMMD